MCLVLLEYPAVLVSMLNWRDEMSDVVNFQVSHSVDYMSVSGVVPDGQNYVYISVLNEDATPLAEGHSLHVRVDQSDVLLELYEKHTNEFLAGPAREIDYEFTQSEDERVLMYYVKPISSVPQRLLFSVFVDQDEVAAKTIASNCYEYDALFNIDYIVQSLTEGAPALEYYIAFDLASEAEKTAILMFDLIPVAATELKVVTVTASLEGADFEFLDADNNPIGKTTEFEVDSVTTHEFKCLCRAPGNAVVRYQVDGYDEVSSVLRVMDIKYIVPPSDSHAYVEQDKEKSSGLITRSPQV